MLGRFLSPDPVFEAGDPNQMGGYTYAGDNPASGSDPNGLMLAPVDGGGGGCDAKFDQDPDTPTSEGARLTRATLPCEGTTLMRPAVVRRVVRRALHAILRVAW